MVRPGAQLKVAVNVRCHRGLDVCVARENAAGEGMVQPFEVQVEPCVRDGPGDEPPALLAVPVRGGEPFGEFLPAGPDPLRVAGEQLAVVRVTGVLGDQGPQLGAEVQLAGRIQQRRDGVCGEERRLARRVAAQGGRDLGVVGHAAAGPGPQPRLGTGGHVAQAAVGQLLEPAAAALHEQDQQVHEGQAHAGDNHVLAGGER